MDHSETKPDLLVSKSSETSKMEEDHTNFEPFTFEINTNDPIPAESGPDKKCNSNSSSSSSSCSSELGNDDDFIHLESLDPNFLAIPISPSPNNNTNNNSNTNNTNNITNANNNNKGNHHSDSDDDSDDGELPPLITYPPVQQMTRSDPNRIPASVFVPKSNIADWSVTSNESLFSIKIANNFSSRIPAVPVTPGSVPVTPGSSVPVTPLSKISDVSEGSMQSFAFPTLAGGDKSKSTNLQMEPSISLNGSGVNKSKPEPELPASSNADMAPQSPAQHGTSEVKQENTSGSIFSCFPCCS